MAEITAFAALRYRTDTRSGDVSDRIAPPYDVLDRADKDALLTRSDRNIVAIDLPHVPPKSLGPTECYERSAETLERWIEDGTLVREDAPAIYAYHQTFTYQGKTYVRRMFIARLKLEPFSAGTVLPHEETFGGPKEDRLALMKTTRANLSPVFALYPDPSGTVADALTAHTDGAPDAVGTIDGVENRLWVVKDGAAIDRLVGVFAGLKVYIADGHHRYMTALNFRDWTAEQSGGPLAAGHPANHVMVVFGSMDDPECLILPTHRVLAGLNDLPLDALLQAWRDGCEEVPAAEADLGLYHGASGDARHVRFTRRDILSSLEPNKSAPWRALDVAYLHRYLIDALFPKAPGGAAVDIRYVKLEDDTRRIAREEHGIALICKAATMGQLRAVSEAGDRMPQKSTFFYPKVATGLTINLLYQRPAS